MTVVDTGLGEQELATAHPQFMVSGEGREYYDLMCSRGPFILGHHHYHPAVG